MGGPNSPLLAALEAQRCVTVPYRPGGSPLICGIRVDVPSYEDLNFRELVLLQIYAFLPLCHLNDTLLPCFKLGNVHFTLSSWWVLHSHHKRPDIPPGPGCPAQSTYVPVSQPSCT